MKKVLGVVMALALSVSGVTAFGGGVEVKAEETNVSRETALEIEDNGFKTGSFTKDESEVGRWYKFTNNSNDCAMAEVTMTHTDGSTWPNYNFFYTNGKSTGNSSYFTGNGKTEFIGVEAHETVDFLTLV